MKSLTIWIYQVMKQAILPERSLPWWPNHIIVQNADLMHFPSTVLTFNKSATINNCFSTVPWQKKKKKSKSTVIRKVTVLTVQRPMCHFSSFQTVLWISSCTKTDNLVNGYMLHKIQAIEKHPVGYWGSLTYVCGCAGSSPRVTLLPWISLKHFSQKWYLLAIRPYFRKLQTAYTIKHRKTRTQV